MNRISTRLRNLAGLSLSVLFLVGVLSSCAPQNGSNSNPSESQPVFAPMQQRTLTQDEINRTTAVQLRHNEEIMANSSVVATGVGVHEDGTPAVWIFTNDRNAANIPTSVEGVHTHVEYVGNVYALAGFTGTYSNPMWSGVSVGNDKECASGTISCVVGKNNTVYLLSCNHVFARENAAKIGEKIDQPGRYDMNCGASGQVAKLSQFIPITIKRNASNVVDCALAEPLAGINWTSQMALNSYMPTATPANATVGMQVKKTGRTTGLTTGTVSAVNVTVNVQYTAGVARFVNQVYITPGTFSAAGDSGSLICEAASNNPVALLFAGGSTGTFGNPINAVLQQLGVNIVTQ